MINANFGNELTLRSIAERLCTKRPIDLLRMRSVDRREEPHATIAEMAEAYLEIIRARQPTGPYALAGSSFGGLVAYEMACRLRERGDAVDVLALIAVDFYADDRPAFSRLTQAWRRLERALRTLMIRPPRQWMEYLTRAMRVRANQWLAWVGVRAQGGSSPAVTSALPHPYIRMCEDIAAYRPRRYDGKVSVFRNALGSFAAKDPRAGLRRAALVEVYDPWPDDGGRSEQPLVTALAQQLDRCLAGLGPSANSSCSDSRSPKSATPARPKRGITRHRTAAFAEAPRGDTDAQGARLKRLFASLAGQETRISASRLAVVVAHPDDETIGIGGQLARLDDVSIVHLTNGAPLAMSYARDIGFTTRTAYAAARRAEVERALATGEAQNACAIWFDIDDQELAFHMADTAKRLARLFAEHGIEMVLTHPFEGGHPDHDAAAFSVWAAASLMVRAGDTAPDIGEMAFYHARADGIVRQRFPESPGSAEFALILDEAAWARKSRMLASFKTQHGTLTEFDSRIERLRLAPSYDFTASRHGPLLHDGDEWRQAAQAALARLGLAKAAVP
jgi:thioesterase domain-containing protein